MSVNNFPPLRLAWTVWGLGAAFYISHLAGTAAGVCNMGVMVGPMLLQPAVGWVLDSRWQGQMKAGARIYELSAYSTGFSLLLIWSILAFICLIFTRETFCQQMS